METLHPKARSDPYGSRINRTHFAPLAYGLPWLSIMIGSLTPFLPVIAPAPLLPPFALLMLLTWRFARPGLLPLWAGLPLGLFDDLFSGQPFGSAVLLFSIALIAIELIEIRFPWRNFWLDWLTASAIIASYLVITAIMTGLPPMQLPVIIPQLVLSVVLFPMIARFVAMLDRLRLKRVIRVG